MNEILSQATKNYIERNLPKHNEWIVDAPKDAPDLILISDGEMLLSISKQKRPVIKIATRSGITVIDKDNMFFSANIPFEVLATVVMIAQDIRKALEFVKRA